VAVAGTGYVHYLLQLLLVVLDYVRGTDRRLIGVLAEIAAGSALAQKIPALVQRDFELVHALVVRVCELVLLIELEEAVLLIDELADTTKDFLILHVGLLRSKD
jgi:hypothetical protein